MAKQKKVDAERAESGASFEDSLEQLQRAVQELESGGLTLTDSLSSYESGVRHLRRCIKLLEQTDLRIRKLVSVDEDGNAQLEDFEHSSTAHPDPDGSSESGERTGVRKSSGKSAARGRNKEVESGGDCDNLF